jgi:hypothetical protein
MGYKNLSLQQIPLVSIYFSRESSLIWIAIVVLTDNTVVEIYKISRFLRKYLQCSGG